MSLTPLPILADPQNVWGQPRLGTPVFQPRPPERLGTRRERTTFLCARMRSINCGGVSVAPAVIATRLAPDSVDTFLGDDRNHHQPGNRIGPPPAKHGVEKQAAQQDR